MNKLIFANPSKSLQEIPDSKVGEIVEQFIRDVNKSSYNASISWNLEDNILTLNEFIRAILINIFKESQESFWQLLYSVDLEEEMVKRVMESESSFEDLSKLVLLREWQKVMLREKFSNR